MTDFDSARFRHVLGHFPTGVTVVTAMWVAKRARAKSIALFHHDPMRTDDALDEMLGCCRSWAERTGIDVFAAHEGDRVQLGSPA